MVDTSSWPTYPLGDLVKKVEIAQAAGKYTLIVDRQGNVATFFSYKGKLIDFHKEKMKVTMGSQSKEDALENLRKAMVYAMKNGDNFCINTDAIVVDWKSEMCDDAIFNAQKVFDMATWTDNDKEIWKPYVKDDENSGPGGLNPGHFICNSKFGLSICTSIKDEADLAKLMECIPHVEKFEKFVIQ